jgi:hypothetical protein
MSLAQHSGDQKLIILAQPLLLLRPANRGQKKNTQQQPGYGRNSTLAAHTARSPLFVIFIAEYASRGYAVNLGLGISLILPASPLEAACRRLVTQYNLNHEFS